ncbi:MAG: DUF354 domain-containing protein, partial [Bacteroidales bacterium]|nr:DUF354 domain-containing protein [Bacteroidales bacterium]
MLKPSKRKINKVIIEIGHPNDVHQFKYLYSELLNSGIDVLFLVKKKDIVIELMDAYCLPYKVFGITPNGLFRKLFSIPVFTYRYLMIAIKYKPDVILSRVSPHSGIVSFILRIPHIGFTDTENVGFLDTFSVPFTNIIFTSESYKKEYKRHHFRYPGYIETWYLHPKRYKPNPDVLKMLEVKEGEKYFILRFVSWQAHHDRGLTGLTDEFKIRLVNLLQDYGKVFISSEKPLPTELERYRFSLPPQYMHDALYYATIFYGESATMASECAMLGTPAFFLDPRELGYIKEQQEKYGLVNYYKTDLNSLNASIEHIKKTF